MPGKDLTVIGNKHWIREAEALDASGDLSDLLPRVSARISLVGAKLLNASHDDLLGQIRTPLKSFGRIGF